MRNFVLSNLAMDSLGPTFGYNEIIPTKPTDRYYTGILAPRDAILAEDDIPEYEESDINSDKKELCNQLRTIRTRVYRTRLEMSCPRLSIQDLILKTWE